VFIQPRSSDDLEREIAKGSDPFTEFVYDTLVADPRGEVKVGVVYYKFEF
jgi:hypothetical protein